MIELRQCPRIESPCAQPPTFAPGQRAVFCTLCQKQVHNLSAMSASEQAALLARESQPCVRYRVIVPLLAAAAMSSAPAVATESQDHQVQVMEHLELVGGGHFLTLPLLLQSDLPESFDEPPREHSPQE